MIEDIEADAKTRMDKTITVLSDNFSKVRTGRANTGILDGVNVEYYGVEVPLNQAANVSIEDARTITIKPFEESMVGKVERALMAADLGLNPNAAGQVIRLVLPPLTEERRKDLVKVVRREAEESRVAIRHIRRDANNDLKELESDSDISADDQRDGENRVQTLTDQHTSRIDDLLKQKEQEIMTV